MQLPCSPQVTAGGSAVLAFGIDAKKPGPGLWLGFEWLGPGNWCLCASAVTGVLDPSLMVEDPKIPPGMRSNSCESPPWPHYTTFLHFG